MSVIKEISTGLYLIKGPGTRLLRLPVPDRLVVALVGDGDLWIYGPVALTDAVCHAMSELGRPRCLVIPNRRGVAHVSQWQATWPDVAVYADNDTIAHARDAGLAPQNWQALEDHGPWPAQFDHYLVKNGWGGAESVFFHHDSKSLILSDLILNLETAEMPPWSRPFAWLMGIDDSDGKMPPTFKRRNKAGLLADVEHLLSWEPERILLRHGRCYMRQGTQELTRAFRRLLRDRDWDKALETVKREQGRIDPR